jgi:hypothetical protein
MSLQMSVGAEGVAGKTMFALAALGIAGGVADRVDIG